MTEVAKSFPFFPRLPREIKAEIWNEALREPNIVQLCFSFQSRHATLHHRVLPTLLQVCAESRGRALKYYPDKFYEQKHTGITIYVRPKVDTLYLGSANVDSIHFEWIVEEMALRHVRIDMDEVKHLAFDINFWLDHGTEVMLHVLPSFQSLETLTLVLEDNASPREPTKLVELDEEIDKDAPGLWGSDYTGPPGNVVKFCHGCLGKVRTVYDEMRKNGGFEEEDMDWVLPELRVKKLVGNIMGQKWLQRPT
ncbi:hypothetical protein B0J13DRAFT_565674 [Dactylonectria estremocensis]|uniref:2EXR domain-containing protein n=1 Tax=Dactylonectria estremocensis TaxID=1079267 RepID=A0A9P9IMS2_9HYPO|nr:hypothetical protein B0J13DRAFT_565674 [Dactylonectria estremocensis]